MLVAFIISKINKTNQGFLSDISHFQYNKYFEGLSVLRIIMLVLLIANFVRLVTNDSFLSFGSLISNLSTIRYIDTSWITTISTAVRNLVLGNLNMSANGNFIIEVVLKLIQIILVPITTILYLLVGLLNVIWFCWNFFIALFGSKLFL